MMRFEEAHVNRVGIRTANELDFNDVMCRDHPRVAWVKLIPKTFICKPPMNRIHPVRHDQRGALLTFREEIAHRPVQGTSQSNLFALASDQSERAVDLANLLWRSREHALPRLFHGHIVNLVQAR